MTYCKQAWIKDYNNYHRIWPVDSKINRSDKNLIGHFFLPNHILFFPQSTFFILLVVRDISQNYVMMMDIENDDKGVSYYNIKQTVTGVGQQLIYETLGDCYDTREITVF